MIEAVAQRIWSRGAFHRKYRALVLAAISQAVGAPAQPDPEMAAHVVPRLLGCATHLAAAARPEMRAAAYRIAVAAWTVSRDDYDNLPEVQHFIFGRLGNFPAVERLFRGSDGERGTGLPLQLLLEILARSSENTVEVTAGKQITLTDFQRHLWETLSSGGATAVVAPTSAGKSYVLQHFLARVLLHSASAARQTLEAGMLPLPKEWGLYIVPTRALITQVSVDLMALLEATAGGDAGARLPVVTIPIPPSEIGAESGIYVLTQERLQTLLSSGVTIHFGTVIIDEAQMLGDGARGIILQTVVEELRRRSPSVQLLFGSPQTSNPEIFQSVFGLGELASVRAVESPVSQNLIFLDTDPTHLDRVTALTRLDGEDATLGVIDVGVSLAPGTPQALAALSWHFGRGEKSLIYAGGPAGCENLANLIVQLAAQSAGEAERSEADAPSENEAALAALSEFLREHIHPQYLLADAVLAGVGFHYGQMPSTVRKTLETYFRDGRFSHLVCTSTLLAGVNLPARNIFLFDPIKGQERDRQRGTPLTSVEFWNLAGRAGRLGKDFEGNVYIVDHRMWQADPLSGPKEQELNAALDTAVVTHGEAFLDFVRDREHRSGVSPAAENTFVKLVNESRRGTLGGTLDRMFRGARSEVREAIEAEILGTAETTQVPVEVLEHNANVSVFRQEDLLLYFRGKIERDGPDSVIPLHPLAGEGVYDSLLGVFGRISRYLERVPHRAYVYYARLALRWMRGHPLVRLIEDAYDYKSKNQKREPAIATVIRAVMSDVEQHLRFRYVKYTSCYNDLLRAALLELGREEEAQRIPNLPLYLELGASSGTMVSLIGMGLTRTTAGAVAEFAANKDLSRPEAERWLRQQNWEGLSLSPIFTREISEVLRQYHSNKDNHIVERSRGLRRMPVRFPF